ncbi:MAG: adenylosuccinate lyase [Chloroflexi bacterium]|nr:adenylosuccinate lyase [Chloroflexota bacterium]
MSDEGILSEASALDALSPLDGRYTRESEPLRRYFSEASLIRERVRVQVHYLLALSQQLHLVRSLSPTEAQFLNSLADDFSPVDAKQVKSIEQTTRHDVKAVEYYLRGKLASTSLADVVEWIHFGLTSEDVNLIAQAAALRDSRDSVLLPALDRVLERLAALARRYQHIPMLARTHGQPAVPTTLGKEFATFYARLRRQRLFLSEHRFEAKLTGAVGNYNALAAAAPQVDWIGFSVAFIQSLGLEPNLITTQLVPYDNWIRYFDTVRSANSILLDLAQDVWRYVSDDYLTSRTVAAEVGSSTMPQKVNPIDFENAEGNLGLANALLMHYAQKLPVSRLQRDLSDSTVRRTFGEALGHTLVAYVSLVRGLDRVQANEDKLRADLISHWEVVAEGAQTILRAAGISGAYEELKAVTRGKKLTEADYQTWVKGLGVDESVKTRLFALTPLTYIGLAPELVDRALADSH